MALVTSIQEICTPVGGKVRAYVSGTTGYIYTS